MFWNHNHKNKAFMICEASQWSHADQTILPYLCLKICKKKQKKQNKAHHAAMVTSWWMHIHKWIWFATIGSAQCKTC